MEENIIPVNLVVEGKHQVVIISLPMENGIIRQGNVKGLRGR